MKVLRLLHEPTVAALAYGHQKSFSGNLVVVDLGEGTLVISVLEAGDGVYEILYVSGDPKLRGSDDEELLSHIILTILQLLVHNVIIECFFKKIKLNRIINTGMDEEVSP